MRTLILSNYLRAEFPSSIVRSEWGQNHPLLSDFQCVVLDMKLETYIASTTPTVNYTGHPFYRLSNEVIRLLQAGGVVVCLNYYTFLNTGSKFIDSKVHQAISEKRRTNFNYEYKFQGQEETSYDWLDLGFLKSTELDSMNAMAGQQIKLISTLEVVRKYFERVKEYHKIILGISRESGPKGGSIRSTSRDRDTPDYSSCHHTDNPVEILAVAEISDYPIAITIKYGRFPGTLIFLPTYNFPNPIAPPPNTQEEKQAYEEKARLTANALCDLGEHYYEASRRELGVKLESPLWLLEYRAKSAKDADKELEDLEKAKATALDKRDKYDRMLTLINGYGEPLQKAIGELFGKEWFGFDVQETERGHPIDLFVKKPVAGKILAVQVTGVVGKLTQDDKHFGALMSYLPENEAKNADGQVERIVLVVNTYRDTPLANRTDENDISVPVQKLVKKNGICLIRACDLYKFWNLWVESPEKLSAEDIFKQLLECEGILQP